MPVGDTHERLDDAAPEPVSSTCFQSFRQRIQVNVLRSPAFLRCIRIASLRPTNALPVGRTVAGPPVLRRIYEGLRQYRLQAVPLLPVPGQPPNRHRQHLRGQIRNPNPRENQEPGVAHHPLQTLRPIPVPPANPGVTTGKPSRARFKQQTAQLATPTIPQPVAQETAERMPVTQLMMPIQVDPSCVKNFLQFLVGVETRPYGRVSTRCEIFGCFMPPPAMSRIPVRVREPRRSGHIDNAAPSATAHGSPPQVPRSDADRTPRSERS